MSSNDDKVDTGYTPNAYVKIGHGTPHVDTNGNIISGDFETSTTYFMSVAVVPIVIMALGLIAIIIFQLVLLSRCLFTCSKCAPNEKDIDNRKYGGIRAQWAHAVVKKRRFLFGCFVFFLVTLFAADHALFYGNQFLTDGVNLASDKLTILADEFSTLSTSFTSTGTSASDLSDSFTTMNNACTGSSSLSGTIDLTTYSGYITDFKDNCDDIAAILSKLPEPLNKGKDYLQSYGVEKKNLVVYIFYAFIAAVAIAYALCVFLRKRFGGILMRILIAASEIILIPFTIMVCIEFIFVIFLGDFCYDPINIILSFTSGDVKNNIEYFVTCDSAKDPFTAYTTGITDAIDDLEIDNCAATPYNQLSACEAACNALNVDVAALSASITATLAELLDPDCEPYKGVLLGFIEDSFCDSAYSGLFVMWICQFICSGCLYCTMCCASVLYHYFDDKYWTLTPDGYSQASGSDVQMDNVYDSTAVTTSGDAPVYDAKKAVELTTKTNVKRL